MRRWRNQRRELAGAALMAEGNDIGSVQLNSKVLISLNHCLASRIPRRHFVGANFAFPAGNRWWSVEVFVPHDRWRNEMIRSALVSYDLLSLVEGQSDSGQSPRSALWWPWNSATDQPAQRRGYCTWNDHIRLDASA
jgi:hypothetical protein